MYTVKGYNICANRTQHVLYYVTDSYVIFENEKEQKAKVREEKFQGEYLKNCKLHF